MIEPDYQAYSLEDLYDVRQKIDRAAYPERYERICAEIHKRETSPQAETIEPDNNQHFATPAASSQAKVKKPRPKPTKYRPEEAWWNVILAVMLMGFGVWSATDSGSWHAAQYVQDSARSSGHLWVMSLTVAVGCVYFAASLVEIRAASETPQSMRPFAKWMRYVGLGTFLLALCYQAML